MFVRSVFLGAQLRARLPWGGVRRMAEALGVHNSIPSLWFSGRRPVPAQRVDAVAAYLGVSTAVLVDGAAIVPRREPAAKPRPKPRVPQKRQVAACIRCGGTLNRKQRYCCSRACYRAVLDERAGAAQEKRRLHKRAKATLRQRRHREKVVVAVPEPVVTPGRYGIVLVGPCADPTCPDEDCRRLCLDCHTYFNGEGGHESCSAVAA